MSACTLCNPGAPNCKSQIIRANATKYLCIRCLCARSTYENIYICIGGDRKLTGRTVDRISAKPKSVERDDLLPERNLIKLPFCRSRGEHSSVYAMI